MLRLFRHRTTTRIPVVFTMILALLLAQGLRVCVHSSPGDGAFHATTGMTHLETNLDNDDGGGATSSEWHASFSIVLKQLGNKFELLAIAVAVLILPLLPVARRLPVPPAAVAPLASVHALRPPLRAPPF
jgi:hypothetical protein